MSRGPDAAGDAAARALHLAGQVQAFGLASAAAVAERYIGTVDRYLAQWPTPGSSLAGLTGEGGTGGSGRRGPETVELPAVPAGACSEVPLWVHNPTTGRVTVELRMAPLFSADGHSLPLEAVSFVPGPATAVPPHGVAQVRVRVLVPVGAPAGHFHALLTSTATPRQGMPVHLEVQAGEGRT